MSNSLFGLEGKFRCVLRIGTTINNVSFFQHHREVEYRAVLSTRQLASVKNSIYSLIDLREILLGCNRRYLEFLSALDDHSAGARALERLTEPKRDQDRQVKGLNLLERTEQALLRAQQRPEFNIHGMPEIALGRAARPTSCARAS